MVWVVLFIFLFQLKDTRPGGAQKAYDHALRLFQDGRLADSQREAEEGRRQFGQFEPVWSAKFQVLQAKNMVGRGMYDGALAILTAYHLSFSDPDLNVQTLASEAVALTHQQQLPAADKKILQAEKLCNGVDLEACGDVIMARGVLAVQKGLPAAARASFLESFSFDQAHKDRWSEATSAVNLGWLAIQIGHFDEAVDWSRSGYRDAQRLGAENIAQVAAGNLGWAYLQLGDNDRALEQFLQAEKSAVAIGNFRYELKWTSAAGYVYLQIGDTNRATDSYRRALALARQIDSKEDIVNALEDLAQVSVDSGDLDQAGSYIAQVTPMELAGGNHLSPNILLTEGMLAAARHQDPQAQTLFHQVQNDATSPTTTRLNAGYESALLLEREGNNKAAETMFQTTLDIFDSAQSQLKSEESKLPFVANAARIYDDYVQLLVREGRSKDALEVADQSRARTLMQALGVDEGSALKRSAAIDPRAVARKTGATLLFYWLGPKQSYLWAITPSTMSCFPLPPQQEISDRVDRYNKFLLNLHDPLAAANPDGQDLYKILVAPAAEFIRPNVRVMILVDGALTRLNFETLLVPGPAPSPAPGTAALPASSHTSAARPREQVSNDPEPPPALHYLLDDEPCSPPRPLPCSQQPGPCAPPIAACCSSAIPSRQAMSSPASPCSASK